MTDRTAPTIYTIFGRVSLPNGAPAPRVIVKIGSMTGMDRTTFSDDLGRYEFREIPRGRYYMTAENPAGRDQFTDPVEADTTRAMSGRLQVHIFLREKVTPDEAPGKPVLTVAEATQHVPKPARKAFEEAIKFLSKRQPDKALASLDRSIELFPDYFQALAERGHVRVSQGQMKDAAQDFAKALELNPRFGLALRGAGMCKIQEARFAEAVRDLEQAIGFEPGDAINYLFLGLAYMGLDKRPEARMAFQQALSLDGTRAVRAHVNLANLYARDRRYAEAAAELRTYLSAVPDAPDADRLRALEADLRTKAPRD